MSTEHSILGHAGTREPNHLVDAAGLTLAHVFSKRAVQPLTGSAGQACMHLAGGRQGGKTGAAVCLLAPHTAPTRVWWQRGVGKRDDLDH
jgi:hypothetical protein